MNKRFLFNSPHPFNRNNRFYQEQLTRGALRKSCSEICSKFTGEHPCRSVISTKLLCNFIEIKLQHGCSVKWNFIPKNLLHIFRTHFYKNTSRGLLLCSCTGDDVYWDSFQLCIQNPVIHLRWNKTPND